MKTSSIKSRWSTRGEAVLKKTVIFPLKATARYWHSRTSVPPAAVEPVWTACWLWSWQVWRLQSCRADRRRCWNVPSSSWGSVSFGQCCWICLAGRKGAGRVRENARWWVETRSEAALQLRTSSCAVRVGDIAVQHGSWDDLHDVHGGPGEGHPIATQPLAERLGLTSQLLQLVLVLEETRH